MHQSACRILTKLHQSGGLTSHTAASSRGFHLFLHAPQVKRKRAPRHPPFLAILPFVCSFSARHLMVPLNAKREGGEEVQSLCPFGDVGRWHAGKRWRETSGRQQTYSPAEASMLTPTDTGPCNQAIPASALRNGTDRPQPPVPVPVGPLPAHCVLPERNDGPVILDDVVVVLAIWGQGLGRPGHWRSPDRGNTRGGWLGRRAVSPHCLLLTLQPRSAPAPRPAPPSKSHALKGHALHVRAPATAAAAGHVPTVAIATR